MIKIPKKDFYQRLGACVTLPVRVDCGEGIAWLTPYGRWQRCHPYLMASYDVVRIALNSLVRLRDTQMRRWALHAAGSQLAEAYPKKWVRECMAAADYSPPASKVQAELTCLPGELVTFASWIPSWDTALATGDFSQLPQPPVQLVDPVKATYIWTVAAKELAREQKPSLIGERS